MGLFDGGGGGGFGGDIGDAIDQGIGGGGGGGGVGDLVQDLSFFGATTGVNFAINKEQTRQQKKFLRQFRKTQYQAALGDLRLAGLNPILAGQINPSGASTQLSNFNSASGLAASAAGRGATAAGTQAKTARELSIEQAKLIKEQQKKTKWETLNTKEQRLQAKLINSRLASDLPVWEERFKANNSALGRVALRGARERELNQAELQQIKDLYNPFSSGVAKPIDLQFRRK